MAQDGQKFIKRNRAPRVHIEYEVATYGSVEKVSLPFVMGIMSDLSGKSEKEKKAMAERDFSNVDMDNFGEFQKSIAPRAAFFVENKLTGEGKLAVDLTFNTMDDLRRVVSPNRFPQPPSYSKRAANCLICSPIWTARTRPRALSTSCSRIRNCCRRLQPNRRAARRPTLKIQGGIYGD